MDEALKNSLWNVSYITFWSDFPQSARTRSSLQGRLLTALWIGHFDSLVDELSDFSANALAQIRELFMASEWTATYNFVEFIAANEITDGYAGIFIDRCNTVLEKHVSAYRFVDNALAPITSDEEIAAVEQTLSLNGKFGPVSEHILTALARLGDRQSPDYRNSIKESVSAVESACKITTGDPKATLGQALKQLGLHPALEKGFSAIYGYTSDAQGIRHALLNEPTVDADDAKFFMVSCSAFVNYLIAKSAAAAPSK